MSTFNFKKKPSSSNAVPSIQDGVHSAVIVQVANIGLQLAFNKEDDPVEQMAVVFELETGELVAKRMKFSSHPSSGCYAVFTAALPDQDADDDEGVNLHALLGKPVLIEVEIRGGKWPNVTEVMPLEEGFIEVTPTTELLEFDSEEIDREVYLKMRRDVRSWVSKRVRHS